MTDHEVEAGVPVPPSHHTGGGTPKYPWSDMEPGDSFFVPYEDRSPATTQATLSSCGRSWCERNQPGWRCVTRREDGGVRVWLVEEDTT